MLLCENRKFELISENRPQGGQPKAIEFLVDSILKGSKNQTLLGITGSGKTFTIANIIEKIQKPSLIMAHNKTLAAQLYAEMKSLFPRNSVEYFVSYYDYYQPEAYIPKTDTYIEKDSAINAQIDRLRHSATRSLLERRDTIVVASVSAIYGLGSPQLYQKMTITLDVGDSYSLDQLLLELVNLQYSRKDIDFQNGSFRVKGDIIDIFPAHSSKTVWRLSFLGNTLESIHEIDSLTCKKNNELKRIIIFANSHFATPKELISKAIKTIEKELEERYNWFISQNRLVEAQRIKQKVLYDLEMLQATGHCKGIENYSKHFLVDTYADRPSTLFEYLPSDGLLFIDESHVMVPQIRSMFNGDRARKEMLVEHGFRLPSAFDNRPLKFEEWDRLRPQTLFVSATPGEFETNISGSNKIELIIRPTGLLDPICEIKPAKDQVDDLFNEIKSNIEKDGRVLVTCLTKKMAESLTDFLLNRGIKVKYIHSDTHTLDRIEIINELRSGDIDVLVGINLLREGLDIPECSLVAILDADKEGFLRSKVSLIQTIGRAARNSEGRVILYADHMTDSIKAAVEETKRRREIQIKFNEEHGITPKTIRKEISYLVELVNKEQTEESKTSIDIEFKSERDLSKAIKTLNKNMLKLAKEMRFEEAAKLRDKIKELEVIRLNIS